MVRERRCVCVGAMCVSMAHDDLDHMMYSLDAFWTAPRWLTHLVPARILCPKSRCARLRLSACTSRVRAVSDISALIEWIMI